MSKPFIFLLVCSIIFHVHCKEEESILPTETMVVSLSMEIENGNVFNFEESICDNPTHGISGAALISSSNSNDDTYYRYYREHNYPLDSGSVLITSNILAVESFHPEVDSIAHQLNALMSEKLWFNIEWKGYKNKSFSFFETDFSQITSLDPNSTESILLLDGPRNINCLNSNRFISVEYQYSGWLYNNQDSIYIKELITQMAMQSS